MKRFLNFATSYEDMDRILLKIKIMNNNNNNSNKII